MPKNAERVLNIPDRRRREDKDRHKSDSERERTSVAIDVEKKNILRAVQISSILCGLLLLCLSAEAGAESV